MAGREGWAGSGVWRPLQGRAEGRRGVLQAGKHMGGLLACELVNGVAHPALNPAVLCMRHVSSGPEPHGICQPEPDLFLAKRLISP